MAKAKVKLKQFGVRVNGVLIRRSFASATEARKWQRAQKQVQDEIRSGSSSYLQPTLLSVHAVEWLKSREHMESYNHHVTWMGKYVLTRPEFKDKYLHELHAGDWYEVFGEKGELMKVHGLSPATHNRVRAMVSKMYTDARRKYKPRRVAENPIADVEPLPEPKKKPQFIPTAQAVEDYLKAAYADRHPSWGIYSMIKLNTGLRQGNVMALTWKDWEGKKLWVRTKFSRRRGFVPGTKSGDEEKYLGVSPILMTALEQHKRKVRPASDDELICLGLRGEDRMTIHQIWDANRRTMEAASIPYMSEHKLRHTYATHYLRNGGKMNDLKIILFHSTINVTEIYSHAVEEDLTRRASVYQVGLPKKRAKSFEYSTGVLKKRSKKTKHRRSHAKMH